MGPLIEYSSKVRSSKWNHAVEKRTSFVYSQIMQGLSFLPPILKVHYAPETFKM